ncbi:hypothetical protein Dda3937_00991 [Dickeya dadantii 3937]|uniref:Uncharacterized protein n=1 Tax=Dickeya dadantii (strain 3937) TaxID=198628 RepID=E0SN85_DICD3|nr:hypothetical protein Dda3937_00991 [Dickeya dadantii 3937]
MQAMTRTCRIYRRTIVKLYTAFRSDNPENKIKKTRYNKCYSGFVALISDLYPSYFKLQVRWLSSLTPVTYLSKLLGIRCVAAFLQLELFRV